MSLVEGMHGRGAGVLGVRGGAMTETRAGTMGGGVGGDVLARFAKVVRAGVGVGPGLVHVYLAGAIGTMIDYKER